MLRDGGCLLLVLPPDHLWPSEGDRQQALRRGDRLSLPRLQLVPRSDVLSWRLPHSHGLPVRITWREPQARPDLPPVEGAAAWPEEAGRRLYRTLLLDGDGVDQRSEVLRADPQSPSGWQGQRLEQIGRAHV